MDWVGRASDCSSALRMSEKAERGAAMQTFPIRRVHIGQKWPGYIELHTQSLDDAALKEQDLSCSIAVDPEGTSARASQLTTLPAESSL